MTLSADSDVVFYESFNGLSGQGGNDGYFDNSADGTVEVGAEDLLDSSLLDNTTGWGDFVKVAICDQCIRIATKKNSGSITTPAFSLNGQSAKLTFNAAATETYYIFCKSTQVGFGGFEFTAGTNGISEIAAEKTDANAPVYNLAGQRVSKNAKGILIQNGKKFIAK